ncbi:MAG: hypothetical protein ACLFN8_04370 [Candidatus Woesearchaeota archaeon]
MTCFKPSKTEISPTIFSAHADEQSIHVQVYTLQKNQKNYNYKIYLITNIAYYDVAKFIRLS